MSNDRSTILKSYSSLPVVVVEDHNEVLPHIYRSIGARYLPMSGVTLIHFDSHPDMLIPASMPADLVYKKHQLFESLSIENWILPAVYAGHISHVVWIKPPWCSQVVDQSTEFYVGKCKKTGTIRSLSIENWILPAVYAGHISHVVWIKPPWCSQVVDQSTEFYVGKCKKTGTIRTTCNESYFLSETLYVPEHDLENKQKLKFTCFTLCPKDWNNQSTKRSEIVNGSVSGEVNPDFNRVSGEATEVELNVNNSSNSTVNDSGTTGAKRGASPHQDDELNKKQKVLKGKGDNKTVSIENDNSKTNEGEGSLKKKYEQFVSPCAEMIQTLETDIENVHYVLDIDLDFYSTMNPFKEMYGENQYKILQELYRFTRPKSITEQDLTECVKKRDKQLSDMKNVLKKIEQDPKAMIEHEKADLIQRLVSDLRASSLGGQLDFDLLHEAGCTCDDTELPHHISSSTQIASLVDATQELLSFLKKPTFITIARSSSDDYCPPNQVDHIQTSVLDLLQELYLEIAVTMDYEQDAID